MSESKGLHLSSNVDKIAEILTEYFSPEELFEIFHLDLLDEESDEE